MNRQLKRANEKSDRKREREQERRKAQRRQSRVRVTQAKTAAKDARDNAGDSSKDGGKNGAKKGGPERTAHPAPGTRRPWITVAYLLLAVTVILVGAWIPTETDPFSLVVHTLIYLTLGYFLSLWLYRRGTSQALTITVVGGMLLAFGVEGLKLALPQLGLSAAEAATPNLLFTYLALPGLGLGAWLGRAIFRRSA